jgi:Zn finger protein HypA/HybF involved in hydrogenase expression
MIWLKSHIEAIEGLLATGTPESLTFAALRARLALEEVCYQRLRNAHDYISADDLRRWQPREVVKTLIQEVDPYAASDLIFSMCPDPAPGDVGELSAADYEAMEFVEVGRQKGFNAAKLGKVWNSLGSFLHVPVPQSSSAPMSTFGEPEKIERRVREALEVLASISEGTLILGGFGEATKFQCGCGTLNKRRAALLKAGQVVNCFNPDCRETWSVEIDGQDIGFRRCSIDLKCPECGEDTPVPRRFVMELEREQRLSFNCASCSKQNLVVWKLMHAVLHDSVEATAG